MEIKPEVVKREQSDGAQQITFLAAVNVTHYLHTAYKFSSFSRMYKTLVK